MFRSAAIKLTAWYLAIIMLLSVCFSTALYRISALELGRGLRRQTLYFAPQRSLLQIDKFREGQLAEGRDHLRANLIMFNLITLVVGGAASYALARRTLAPIEEAMEAQSRFTADASHELRTPLTAMQTEIEVALRDGKLTPTSARQLLNSNLEEVAKLKALSEGLLRLARYSATEPPKQAVDLRAVIEEAADRAQKAANAKNIALKVSSVKARLRGDQPSLTEAVVILLDNAIKYSPDGTTVCVLAKTTGLSAEITVVDEGPGIKPNDLPHIFDRFYRVDSARTAGSTQGYGLGLSIARQIIKVHHGSIHVKSRVASGSSFTIKLPLLNYKQV